MTDRTVHAVTRDGCEVVRYDRAGKWFIESPHARRALTLREAAIVATESGAEASLGLPGGSRFDALVRERMAL